LYDLIKKDLDTLFPQYQAKIEETQQECWALKSNNPALIKSKGGEQSATNDFESFEIQNCPINVLIDRLDWIHKQKVFFIDDTGIKGNVDLKFTANLTDIDAINEALAIYGLSFIKEKRPISVLAISDRQVDSASN